MGHQFKEGDVIIGYSQDGKPHMIGIVAEDELQLDASSYVTVKAYREPPNTKWRLSRGAWEVNLSKLHPKPDKMWASYVAVMLTGDTM